MSRVYERFRSQVLPRESEDIRLENTLQYNPYEDETQNKQMFLWLVEELEPMPEVAVHYIGAKILLPRVDKMARSHVVAWSHNANQNVMGRAHMNPILDTQMYQVEFTGGKVTELTTNAIAESMYAQCDGDGNEYLLLDALVNYQKDNRAISQTEQQTYTQGRSVTHKTTAGWQFASSERMVLPHDRSCPSKKNPIWCRQLSLLLCRELIMSQLLTGGLGMS